MNYAVVYPTTDDDAPVSVDLFLTATYDVQAEVILNIKSGLTDQPGGPFFKISFHMVGHVGSRNQKGDWALY